MNDFCITYRGNGWNGAFRDVLHFYHMETPRHQAMQSVRGAVQDHARTHLVIWDEALLHPGGQRDPFASPLTPRTLERRPRDAVLSGEAPEGVLLLMATDRYLATLTQTAATTSASGWISSA